MANFSPTFGAFGSFGASGGGFKSYSPGSSSGSTGLTPLQMLELAYVKGQQNPHHGLLGRLFHGATHGVNDALQFISRPAAAVATGADVAVRGGDAGQIAHGARLGITGKSHLGFGQVLEDAGLLKGHRTLRGLAGFGLDVATDPIMLASIAAAPVTGGSSLSFIAEREAAMEVERGTLSKAARLVLTGHEAKDMASVEEARNLLRTAGLSQTASVADKRLSFFDRKFAVNSKGEAVPQITDRLANLNTADPAVRQTLDDMNVGIAGANEEFNSALGARYLHAKYRIPFGKTMGMEKPYVGFNTRVKAPSLKAVAENKILQRVPVLRMIPGAAEHLGTAFKPDWNDKSFHAMKMVGTRITEHLSDQNVNFMRHALADFTGGKNALSKDSIFHALDWGETNVGIIKGSDRKFNVSMANKAVKSGQITNKEAKFLAAWHGVTEHMRLQDEAYGLKYDKPLNDVVYVPHIYDSTGNPISSMSSMFTKPGFEYKRLTYKAKSVKGLKELYDAGVYRRSVETDPQRLLAIRIRRGARAASENTVRTSIAASLGIPTHVIDGARLAKRLTDHARHTEALKKLDHLRNTGTKLAEARTVAQTNWERRVSNYIKGYDTKATKKTKSRYVKGVNQKLRVHQNMIKYLEKRIRQFEAEFKGTKMEGVAQPNELLYRLAQEKKKMRTTMNSWAKAQVRFAKMRQKEEDRLTAVIKDKAEKEFGRFEAHNKALDKLEKQMTPDFKTNPGLFARNPAAFAHDMAVEPKLRGENGTAIAIPASMSQALHRIAGTTTNDPFLNEFRSTWQKLLSKWKLGATVVNPGYRVRNTLSDLWNMYSKPENHVPLWAMLKYGTHAASLVKAAHAGNEKAARTLLEAFDHGILAGLFQGDIEQVIRFTSKQGTAKELAKRGKVISAGVRAATTFNRHAENWGRLTHYLYLKDNLHLSSVEAATEVKATHFDYEDLTPTERVIKSNFIPFYTWTRKNIPRQISSFLQAPGRYATFPKFVNESEYASGDNKGQIIPSWMKNQLAFHVPFGGKGTLTVPAFGPTDPAKLESPTQLLGMLSPLLKMPAELAFNRNLLTGSDIYGTQNIHPRTPVSGLGASLLSHLPGANVGTTSRTVHGKRVYGPGANPVYSYLASVLPLANIAVNQSSNIRAAQRGHGKAWLSELGGISTFSPDQEQQKGIISQQEKLAFQQFVKGLRDERKKAQPKKRKLTGYQTRLETLLKAQNT